MPKKLNSVVANKSGNATGSAVSSLKAEITRLNDELSQKPDSESLIKHVAPSEIRTGEPFKSLFPVNPELLARIMKSIQERGYDQSQPLIIWKDENLLIDGHTRLKAAMELNLETVPVYYTEIDQKIVLEQTLAYQVDRRNLTDGDILKAIETLSSEGMKEALPGRGKTKDRIAVLLGTNRNKVQKAMTILNRGDELYRNYVLTGQHSINSVYDLLMNELTTTKTKSLQGEASSTEEEASGVNLNTEFKVHDRSLFLRDSKLLEFQNCEELSELQDKTIRKSFLKVFNSLLSELVTFQ